MTVSVTYRKESEPSKNWTESEPRFWKEPNWIRK